MEAIRPVWSFIVRVIDVHAGTIAGTVEQVRTGERYQFRGLDALGQVIERAIDAASGAARTEDDRQWDTSQSEEGSA